MLFLLYFLVCFLMLIVLGIAGWQIYVTFIEPGAIYYPTTDASVTEMLKLVKATPKDTLIDIGSGDGRILIAAARIGTKAIGYEINPLLVLKSRRYIREAGLEKLATVYWKSFWKTDFSEATIVTVYLFPHLMTRLQKLIEKKAKHPIRVVANDYAFPNLKPVKTHKKVYLYKF